MPTVTSLRCSSIFIITLIGLLCTSLGIQAQDFTARVIDQKTATPIPFATIRLGQHSGVVTNEEGYFTLSNETIGRLSDSIRISSMGYEGKQLWLPSQKDTLIALTPATLALKPVFLTNNPLSPEEIIEKVKEQLTVNYADNGYTQKNIFFRQSDLNSMSKTAINFKKSTIEELDKTLIDSIAGLIPKKTEYYRETVGTFYGNYRQQKLQVTKAAELYDKTKDISVDGLSEKLERIFKENVKPNSYLKIKSGIFGTKVQLDSAMAAQEESKDEVIKVQRTTSEDFSNQIKDRISELYAQLFFTEDSEIDVLRKSNRYRFTLDAYTIIEDTPVYVVRFSPKGKKDFKGVMYINTEDYAVMRLEFENVRRLSSFGLFGISYAHTIYRGKSIFSKDANGRYSPRYLELEDGNTFGIDRPLKVIEKNKFVKGRRKQNELSLGIDFQGGQLNKYEMVVFDTQTIDETTFNQVKENQKVAPAYLTKYDPTFWDGYTIMEPNSAIQSFEVQQ